MLVLTYINRNDGGVSSTARGISYSDDIKYCMKTTNRFFLNSSSLVLLSLMAVLLLSTGVSYSATSIGNKTFRVFEGVVIKITDGDTIRIRTSEGTVVKVRLGLIDAPETSKKRERGQPYGAESSRALSAKVMGKRVRVEMIDVDSYKRLVGIVYVGGRCVNLEMVREGFAWGYKDYLSAPYASIYLSAEDEARRSRRGLWRRGNPQPPWEYRKSLKIGGFW